MTSRRLSPVTAWRRPIGTTSTFRAPAPGGRAPHFWLPGRVSIFDLFDTRIYAPVPAAERAGCRRFANGCGKAPEFR